MRVRYSPSYLAEYGQPNDARTDYIGEVTERYETASGRVLLRVMWDGVKRDWNNYLIPAVQLEEIK